METLLAPYRVLDLTDDKGFLAAKVLGDMGADVIKIEPPGGEPSRNIGPFLHGEADPEKSLYWFCYNANKRGITLDLKSSEGRSLFLRLVKKADFIFESFSPSYLDGLGLGYPELCKVKPDIILASISPFGQTGPFRDYKGPDLVAWGMAVVMFLTGDPDRPPVRVSFPQAYLNASMEAAIASLMAHYHRKSTGEGQWVEASARDASICATMNAIPLWEVEGRLEHRVGPLRAGLTSKDPQRQVWACRDGYISFAIWSGYTKVGPISNGTLVAWMDSEGMATDDLKKMDWEKFLIPKQTKETWDRLETPIQKFFLTKTKKELYEYAVKNRILLMPVMTTEDLVKDPQVNFRKFFVEVEHPELRGKLIYPGAFVKLNGAGPIKISRRAPLIGEHNREVYQGELGITDDELSAYKQKGVI